MNEEEVKEEYTPSEIKKAKSQAAGRDVADLAGRAVATYYGGAMGNKIYDAASKTKLGQAVLDNAGKNIGNAPMVKGTLAKAQPMLEKAKPKLEAAANSIGGNKAGAAESGANAASNGKDLGKNAADANSSKKENTNSSNLPSSNGSEKGHSYERYLKKNRDKSNGDNIVDKVEKIHKYWPLIVAAAQVLLVFLVILVIIIVMMSGIMYIEGLFKDADEKFLNFLAGCGWSSDVQCSHKEMNNFYEKVDEKAKNYKKNYSVELDKGLLVATLTYDNPFFDEEATDEESVDYRKKTAQINKLVDHMVSKEGGTYYIDTEKYRDYLENEFIISFYLDGKDTPENREKAKLITDEVFARTSFVSSLAGISNDKNYNVQSVTVTVTNCSGNITLEQTSLTEYLLGVANMYADVNSSDEYLTYVVVAAKNYLYAVNGATINDMPMNLRISSCESSQLYCNANQGCHYLEGTGSSNDTLATGPDSSGNYVKPAVSSQFVTKVGKIIDEKTTEFLVDNDIIVNTKLNSSEMGEIKSKLNNQDYKTVLVEKYGGNFSTVSVIASGYPLDLANNYVTSLYGWRLDPIRYICRHHNGMDIAAPADSSIYAYADGVVVTNKSHSSYGNYTVIGHGAFDSTTNSYEYYTLYAHQIRLSRYVSEGDTVVAGQKIGSVGSTGYSTGNHLHFEIYKYVAGSKVASDPAAYFSNIEFRGLDVNQPLYESKEACLMANQ